MVIKYQNRLINCQNTICLTSIFVSKLIYHDKMGRRNACGHYEIHKGGPIRSCHV